MADLVVEGKIILEIKSVKKLTQIMEAQPGCRAEQQPKAATRLLNYLRLSELPVSYLVNFRNERMEWKRRVLSG